jgi:ArsR family transcriptional regulator, arsenate/arsenite/antimonite-responsive transcriptional repressor
MKRTAAARSGGRIDDLERVFRALSDKTRLRILALIGGNEVCVCHIHDSLGLAQPTVSRHLAYLRRAGLVDTRRDGVWMHYQLSASLDPSVRSVLTAAIAALTDTRDAVQDRKQFERSFGGLYVLAASNGGSCCAPRA